MDIVLIILGAVCLLMGMIGCFVPILPGVPLAYGGLWLLQATERVQFTWRFLIIWGVVVVVVQALDYIVPAWGTKHYGGSKAGIFGSIIGLMIGLFMGPWGIILGPFAGAILGELIAGKKVGKAIRSGWGSFIGLMTGTVLKVICCGLMAYYFIAELI